jgi:replicative DNA helicase
MTTRIDFPPIYEPVYDAVYGLMGLAMMWPGDVIPRHSEMSAEMFPDALTAAMWAAIVDAHKAGHRPVPPLIAQRMSGSSDFAALGGAGFLIDLMDRATAPDHAETYSEVITRGWQARRLNALLASLGDVGVDPLKALAEIKVELEAIERTGGGGSRGYDLTSAAHAYLDELDGGRSRGLMTGLTCIDRRLRGLKPGDLIVLAGRPAMGKTALARNVLHGAAVRHPTVQFPLFSLEMGAGQMAARAVSAAAWDAGEVLPYSDFADAAPDLRRRAREWAKSLPKNLIVEDRAGITIGDISRAVWRYKARGPVGAVVVDYLQIMGRPAAKGRNETSVIGEMTAALKTLAREAGICIILLSQLSRQVESRDNKRPQLSDLRESGSIEQDADAVLFCYREGYYAAKEGRQDVDETELEVICRKNRSGAEGTDKQTIILHSDHVSNRGEA